MLGVKFCQPFFASANRQKSLPVLWNSCIWSDMHLDISRVLATFLAGLRFYTVLKVLIKHDVNLFYTALCLLTTNNVSEKLLSHLSE